MKEFRKVCAALSLAFLISLSAYGGEIGSPGVTGPPPPHNLTATGEIGTPGVTAAGDAPTPDAVTLEPLTEFTLSLLQSILSLF